MAPGISIFIPAYNAARHLPGLISRIPADIIDRTASIWIINDGSTDNTAAVIQRLGGENPMIRPVLRDNNRGYGSTVKEGLALCRGEMCDIAVCLHADGQYPPESLPAMIEHMRAHQLDILQGSRIASGTALSGGMPLYKFAANRVLTACENLLFGLRLTDYHSGYLLYSRRALDTVPFQRLSASFDIDVETIACARKRGLRIGEYPIPTRYADEVSHLNPVSYGVRVVGIMARYCFGAYA